MRPESMGVPPRLSVVVPVYRVEAYLADCLDSILSDPGDDLEVIAVNDGSPDGCGAILDRYARHDPRLRVIHLPANVGLGQARNAGLEHAIGEYVWFVDADDWLPAGALRLVIDRLTVGRPDVLIIDHAEVFHDGSVAYTSADLLRGVSTPIRLADRPQLLRLAQSACTKIARRAYLDEIDLRFQPGWYEDSSFSHPLLIAAQSIDVLDRICYCYRRQTPGGITTTVSARHFEVFDQYERLFAVVDRANGAYETFRPELFRVMINHYLVIFGNDWRLPAELRRAFFRRVVEDYMRWRPTGKYPVPGGLNGLKHRLLRYEAYRAYTLLRLVHRAVARRSPTHGRTRGAQRTISDLLAPPSASSGGARPPARPQQRFAMGFEGPSAHTMLQMEFDGPPADTARLLAADSVGPDG